MQLWLLWAALVGGLAFQVWYTIAWMALPHHHGDFLSPGKDSPLVAALKAAALRPGLYMIPHYADYPGAFKNPEFTQRAKEGPRAWFVTMKPGCEMGATMFVSSYLVNALEALALAFLLSWVAPHLEGVVCVLAFSAFVGLLARVGSYGAQTIWMGLPRRYALTNVVDGVVGFTLAGLVVNLFRP